MLFALLLSRPALAASGDACTKFDHDELVSRHDVALYGGNGEEALRILASAWESLKDACEPVAAEDLSFVAQMAAARARDQLDAAAAARWLESTCRLVPDAIPLRSQGDAAAAALGSACDVMRAGPHGEVVVQTALVLDGIQHVAGDRVSLAIGAHLLQVPPVQAGQPWQSGWQSIDEGLTITLPDRTLVPSASPKSLASASPSIAAVQSRRAAHPMTAPVALTIGGAVVGGVGFAVLELLFVKPWNDQCQGYDALNGGIAGCAADLDLPLAAGLYGGIGLASAGSVLGAAGLGLGVHAALTPQAAQVSVRGSF